MNNPIRYTDPTGHVFEQDTGSGGPCDTTNCCSVINCGGTIGDEPKDNPIPDMKPGDIITLGIVMNGQSYTHNYMLGLMDDGETLGFWNLDSHSYVPYALVVNMTIVASNWTTFRKTHPKTFNSYDLIDSLGIPTPLPNYDVSWTGGMDDTQGYVEIRTQVDWENMPSEFLWAVLGPSLVTSFWGDAKPSVTPVSQAGFFPLTNYILALQYFANDGAATTRYPVIHP